MRCLSVFHSRLGAAALAAALNYSWGGAGRAELLTGLRRLPRNKKQPRAFVRPGEALLVVADAKRQAVLQTAISDVIGCLKPDLELVFYSFEEIDCRLLGLWLWLLARGLLPMFLAHAVAERIWNGVKR